MKTVIVNNTNANIYLWRAAIIHAIETGGELPEDIADLFTLRVVILDGVRRGILEWA